MRLIDADKLVGEVKLYVANIKSIRSDSNCFLTEDNVLSLINSQDTVSTIRITEIRKHESDFSDLFCQETDGKYEKR